MKSTIHNKLYINFGDKGHFFLSTENLENSVNKSFEYGYINTNVTFDANFEAEYDKLNIMPTCDFFTFRDLRESNNAFEVDYYCNNKNALVTENVQFIPNCNCLKQKTIVKNCGGRDLRLSRLSSSNIIGIGIEGSKYFVNKKRFLVHYCINRPQGEGQWQTKTLKELGLFPASTRQWERSTFRIESVSSWDTNVYYPILIIEDTEKNETWFFERECAENWYIEINVCEGWNCPFINVALGGADDKLSWYYDLCSQQSYETTTSVYGVVKGGFEEAVQELHKYKRQDSTVKTDIRVVFNDFMNCNWANETLGKIYPLIDKASSVGVEYFVVDAGWANNGEWKPLDIIFPGNSFIEMIKYINKKGMKAGIWIELETAGSLFSENELRKRDGRLITEHRPKVNLSSKTVRGKLLNVIDFLYNCGIRYIKNDHNNDEKIGSNVYNESYAEGVKNNTKAFYGFLTEIKNKYPDLVIENCSAGGGREDNGTLRYCNLQSSSDQEDYRLYPSVLIGSLANIVPEKLGIWAYPYPLTNLYAKDNKLSDQVLLPESVIKGYEDGHQTVFNMVSGMAGYLYLSGKINIANDFNLCLIKEGIKIYKSYKDSISKRSVCFPEKMKNMDDRTFQVVGLNSGDDLLLYVWNLESNNFSIILNKYGFSNCSKIYPATFNNVEFSYKNKTLDCNFSKEYSACIFMLKK